MENNNQFKVISYNLDLDHMNGTEQVGEITLHFIDQDVLVTNAIWFDEEGDHYFCCVSTELNQQGHAIVEEGLLADYTDYENTYGMDKQFNLVFANNKICPKCLTNELDAEKLALSRQTRTPICFKCGQLEIMEELANENN